MAPAIKLVSVQISDLPDSERMLEPLPFSVEKKATEVFGFRVQSLFLCNSKLSRHVQNPPIGNPVTEMATR